MLWKEGRNNVPHSPRKKLRACVAVAPTRSHRTHRRTRPLSVAQSRRRRAPRTVARRIVDLRCIALLSRVASAGATGGTLNAPRAPAKPLYCAILYSKCKL